MTQASAVKNEVKFVNLPEAFRFISSEKIPKVIIPRIDPSVNNLVRLLEYLYDVFFRVFFEGKSIDSIFPFLL